MTPRILVEKLLAAALTALVVSSFHWKQVLVIYIVAGQAHFATAYYYQALAGKIDKKYMGNYVFWSALLLFSFYQWPSDTHQASIATIYFLFHMCFDELYLSRLPMELRNTCMHAGRLLEMAPLIFVLTGLIIDGFFPFGTLLMGQNPFSPVTTVLAWLSLLTYLGLLVSRRYKPDGRSFYFLLPGLALVLAVSNGYLFRVPIQKISGSIIIYHYLNWYFHYFLNLSETQQKVLYLKRILLINTVVIGAYFTFKAEGLGFYFYSEEAFYIWTMLHLITSTRKGDVLSMLSFPKAS